MPAFGVESSGTEEASKEALAQYCADMLRDSDLLMNMAKENPTLGQKIINIIKSVIKNIKNMLAKNSQLTNAEAQQLRETAEDYQAIVDKWEKAVKAGIKNQNAKTNVEGQKNNVILKDSIQYEVRYTVDNLPVVVISDDILSSLPKSEWIKTVKKTMKNSFSNGIPIKGRLIKVNKISRDEFTNSKNTKYLRLNKQDIYKDKFNISNHLDDIILASTNYINEEINHKRKDNIKEFARGNVNLRIGGNDYTAEVIIGITTGNAMVLYDVVELNTTDFTLKKAKSQNIVQTQKVQNNSADLTNNNVSQTNTSVNSNNMQNGKNNSENEQFQLRHPNDLKFQEREQSYTDEELLANSADDYGDLPFDDFGDLDFDSAILDLENEKGQADFSKILKEDPQEALSSVLASAVKTVKQIVTNDNNLLNELTETEYKKIAYRTIAKSDTIGRILKSDSNKAELGQLINDFVSKAGVSDNINADFSGFIAALTNFIKEKSLTDTGET